MRSARLLTAALAAGSVTAGTAGALAAPAGAASAEPAAAKVRSATGEEVNYRYGIIAVRAFVSGRKLVRISIPVLQVEAQLSQQLAQTSIPVLEHEALRAQSARVATVSGATWTSEGFAMSLQNALSKLHVK
jgi:uncharacterized protein with FMN-binding domain